MNGWFITANKDQHSVNVNGEITILSEEEIGNLIKKALSRSKVVRNLFDQFGVDLSKLNELEIIVVPLRKKFAETDGITMKINKDLSIDFDCIRFSQALDDWGDLSFSAITVQDDDGDGLVSWTLPVTGPDGVVTSGNVPNIIPGRLKIGDNTNYILFEQKSLDVKLK